ncbi:MAG: hypothetical protein RR400_02835 [Clostridia bacterium]
MKKNFLMIMFVCISLLLAGCGDVSFVMQQKSNGEISQIFSIDLRKEEMLKAGLKEEDMTEAKGIIKTKAIKYNNENINNFIERLSLDTTLSLEEKQQIRDGVKFVADWEADKFVYKIQFSTIPVYYYFFEYDPKKDAEDVTIKKELFFNKRVQETKTIFAAKDGNETITKTLILEMQDFLTKKLGENWNGKISMPSLKYFYSVPDGKMFTDADEKFNDVNGNVVHMWNISSDAESRTIHFYYLFPRREVWYAFALLISAVSVCAMFVINHFVQKNKKSKKTKQEN